MRTTALLSAALLSACTLFDGGPAIRLTVATDKAMLSAVDSVRVTATLVNLTGRTISALAPESYACINVIRVQAGAGQDVTIPTKLCVQIAFPPVEVQPRQTVAYTQYWQPAMSLVDGAPLPPGSYRLTAEVMVESQAVTSDAVSITVLP